MLWVCRVSRDDRHAWAAAGIEMDEGSWQLAAQYRDAWAAQYSTFEIIFNSIISGSRISGSRSNITSSWTSSNNTRDVSRNDTGRLRIQF